MTRKIQPQSSPMALVPASKMAEAVSALHHKRSAVAVAEHEDAGLTGMTRSLDRRLLALNLQPVPPSRAVGFMKVA